MISDSQVWRIELWRELRDLRRRLARAENSNRSDARERAGFRLEMFVFNSAFVVRKLIEAHKLSDEFESMRLPVQRCGRVNLGTKIDFMNWDHIDRFYDLEDPSSERLLPRELCNLLIHSFVFLTGLTEDMRRYKFILFNSDRTKNKALYIMDLDTYFKFIERAIEDDIVLKSYNRRTGEVRKSSRLT